MLCYVAGGLKTKVSAPHHRDTLAQQKKHPANTPHTAIPSASMGTDYTCVCRIGREVNKSGIDPACAPSKRIAPARPEEPPNPSIATVRCCVKLNKARSKYPETLNNQIAARQLANLSKTVFKIHGTTQRGSATTIRLAARPCRSRPHMSAASLRTQTPPGHRPRAHAKARRRYARPGRCRATLQGGLQLQAR